MHFPEIFPEPFTVTPSGPCTSQKRNKGISCASLEGVIRQWVTSTAMTSSGTFLATRLTNNTVHLWKKTARGWQLLDKLEGHKIYHIAIDPSDKLLVAGCLKGIIQIWKMPTTATEKWQLTAALTGHNKAVSSILFNLPNRMLTGSHDGTICVWQELPVDTPLPTPSRRVQINWGLASATHHAAVGNTLPGKLEWKRVVKFKGHDQAIKTGAFDSYSGYLVTGARGHTAKIWKEQDSGEWKPCATLSHQNSVHSVAIAPHANYVVTACFSRTAYVWREKNGQWEKSAELKHRDQVQALAINFDATLIFTTHYPGTIQIWREEAPEEWHCLTQLKTSKKLCQLTTHSGGIVTGCVDSTTQVWSWTNLMLFEAAAKRAARKEKRECTMTPLPPPQPVSTFEPSKTIYARLKNHPQIRQMTRLTIVTFALIYFTRLVNGWLLGTLGDPPKATTPNFFCKF